MCVWGLRALGKADDPEETRQHPQPPCSVWPDAAAGLCPAAESLGLVAMHHKPRESLPILSRVQLDPGFQFPEPAKEYMVKSIEFIWMAISL